MNFNTKINEMKEEIIKSTQKILTFKSVKDAPKEGMPFGEGVNQCLEYTLDLAKDLGFVTKNFDGYAGHAEFGNGDETVGILVHLDVVPEGENWTYPPYGGEIHDDNIYGRGTIDDKGPAVACLYAMKALKDSGLPLKKKIRMIFGTDEESGWQGINYYFKHEKAPDMAFSPDADFPVIHGEKGIMIFDFLKELQKSEDNGIEILSIKGGNRANMVPDYCEAHLSYHPSISEKLDSYIRDKNVDITAEEQDNKVIIKSRGISAHGSTPQSGVNAISNLLLFLNTLDLSRGDAADFIAFYCKKIGLEYNGESIGCDFRDEESGRLVFNVGVIDLDNSKVSITINIRYPITYTTDKVYEALEEQLKNTGINLVRGKHDKDPIYLPKDHPLVNKLMKVYTKITGDHSDPITIGGGTYARAMKNAVAFGPLFPGRPELAHQKDEYISIDDLLKITEIYTEALYELAK